MAPYEPILKSILSRNLYPRFDAGIPPHIAAPFRTRRPPTTATAAIHSLSTSCNFYSWFMLGSLPFSAPMMSCIPNASQLSLPCGNAARHSYSPHHFTKLARTRPHWGRGLSCRRPGYFSSLVDISCARFHWLTYRVVYEVEHNFPLDHLRLLGSMVRRKLHSVSRSIHLIQSSFPFRRQSTTLDPQMLMPLLANRRSTMSHRTHRVALCTSRFMQQRTIRSASVSAVQF